MVRYILFLIGPLLFLPLADLPSLSPITPTLLVHLVVFASRYPPSMNPNSWHVNAVLPIVFLSAVLGMRNLLNLIKEPLKQSRLITVGPLLLLVATAFSAYWFGPLPFSRGIHPLRYAVDEDIAQSVKEVRSLIPHEASLAAARYVGSNFTQQRTLLRLATKRYEARFKTVDLAMWKRADYILLDTNPHLRGSRLWWDGGSEDLRRGHLWRGGGSQQLLYRLERSEDYELLYSKNNIWLFKKIAPNP